MLRISIVDSGTRRRLLVEGKLISPWAAELKSACDRARTDLNGRELVIDLESLSVIGEEGENILLGLINDGVRLRGCNVFAKQVLRRMARRARAQFHVARQWSGRDSK